MNTVISDIISWMRMGTIFLYIYHELFPSKFCEFRIQAFGSREGVRVGMILFDYTSSTAN